MGARDPTSISCVWILAAGSASAVMTVGYLTRKQYDDGNGTDYDYTAAGRLETRTWQRSSVAGRLTTDYTYDNGGRMVATNYSDTTPGVSITYDALNRPVTNSNGLATSTFTYNPANLAIDTETVSHDYNTDGTADLTRVIDRSQDYLGRDKGYVLTNPAPSDPDAATEYFYDDFTGRLDRVVEKRASFTQVLNDIPQPFTYTYEPGSYGLVKTVTGPAHTVTNTWDPTRDVLSSRKNEVGATDVSSYLYEVNEIGQRIGLTTAFDLGGALSSNPGDTDWGYDSKGQVVEADHTIPGLDRAYRFDMIGNRLKSAEGTTDPNAPSAKLYDPTALNQYDTIGTLSPDYDLDGNMTDGPVPKHPGANSTLQWDAENRLVSATVNGQTTTYRYDARSRRIATVTSSGAATLTIYDGWNPIAEYSAPNLQSPMSFVRSFTWGMDLSGSMQGAGGVGGLLAVNINSITSYYPTYDGNGNVSEYLDSSGAVVAHYEYDPFGNLAASSGSKAADFSHRFSTKPLDAATGLYYYGYRYYDPVTGRWPSRDPIEEEGGVNLYGFVGNDGVNKSDILGLLVTAVLDKEAKKLTVTDNDTGETITVDAIGDGECNPVTGEITPSGLSEDEINGPMPDGGYFIVDLPADHDQVDKWLALFADDGVFNDTTFTKILPPTQRSGFRLHWGNISKGCCTVMEHHDPDKEKWNKLFKIIKNTKTTQGPKRSKEGPNFIIYGRFTTK